MTSKGFDDVEVISAVWDSPRDLTQLIQFPPDTDVHDPNSEAIWTK